MDINERKAIEAEMLAQIKQEMATNPNLDAEYEALIPQLQERMAAILDRFSDPKDRVEEDVVYLARRELAMLSDQLFRGGVLKTRAN